MTFFYIMVLQILPPWQAIVTPFPQHSHDSHGHQHSAHMHGSGKLSRMFKANVCVQTFLCTEVSEKFEGDEH
jgi:hypothetical protein